MNIEKKLREGATKEDLMKEFLDSFAVAEKKLKAEQIEQENQKKKAEALASKRDEVIVAVIDYAIALDIIKSDEDPTSYVKALEEELKNYEKDLTRASKILSNNSIENLTGNLDFFKNMTDDKAWKNFFKIFL